MGGVGHSSTFLSALSVARTVPSACDGEFSACLMQDPGNRIMECLTTPNERKTGAPAEANAPAIR